MLQRERHDEPRSRSAIGSGKQKETIIIDRENRIDVAFRRLKEDRRPALVPYLTAGYPTADDTVPLLRALEDGGADIIELGVPFSDPIADGPTIQRASSDALAAGITLPMVLELLGEFRRQSQTPVVLFGAYNPFFHRGMAQVAKDAAAAGADAFLIPDLPADEADEAEPLLRDAGLHLIYLVAPTTTPERKALIGKRARGFIYYISLKGVTGARTSHHFAVEQPLQEIRAVSDTPIVVGFGIATPEQAAAVAGLADGVVVGSALIDKITNTKGGAASARAAREYIASLRGAIDGATRQKARA